MKFLLAGGETDRLRFNEIRESDFPQWVRFFEDAKTSEYWLEEKESPEMECEKWYKKQFWRYENDKGGMNALFEKQTNKLVGHCGLLIQTVDGITELEIGYSFLPDFWNKGYATEAAMYCRDFAFLNDFSESLISIISLTNIPSEKVALKNAMAIEKTTVYKGNQVNIFRINKKKWNELNRS